MKKLIIFLVAIFAFVAFADAQRVYNATADTLQGAETVNLGVVRSTSSRGTLALQALCTELGGTSDGTLLLQGSVDGTSYNTITNVVGKFDFYPSDTLTITDGAIIQCLITGSPFNYYRWQGGGTASDTTLITPIYSPKLK
jgi:hypothetical protein